MDYRQSSGAANSWRRARCVTIHNPLPTLGAPLVVIEEEDVVQLGDRITTLPTDDGPAGLRAGYEPEATFPLLNPETGEQVGVMSHAELYAALFSLYMDLATKRDTAAAAPVLAPPPPPGVEQGEGA